MTAGSLPLSRRRVMVTRPHHQADALADPLEVLGAEVIRAPAIRIEPPEDYAELDRAIAGLDAYDWIVFTSVNGVGAFFDRCSATPRAQLAAIGPATAEAIEARGLDVALTPERFVAESLFDALSQRTDLASLRLLIPRADIARAALPRALIAAGAHVDVVTAYRTITATEEVERAAALVEHGAVDAVTFTSGSTVRSFFSTGAAHLRERTTAASIGPITSGVLRELGIEPAIEARSYTTVGLVEAIRDYFDPGGTSK